MSRQMISRNLRQWMVYVPAAIAALGIFVFGLYSLNLDQQKLEARSRTSVVNSLNILRANLEGIISGNMQLVRGLVAIIALEPNLSQKRFAELAAQIFRDGKQLRNIAAAPDLVVRFVYPLAGNEKAVGLDYRLNDAQRKSALKVRDEGRLIIAGPVDLVQGGQGFIGRVPVFKGGRTNDPDAFWGLVSTVIDVDKLYQDGGLRDPQLTIEIAIRGADSTGANGRQFYGRPEIFSSEPVLANITLPYGSWQIAAIPKIGWPKHSENELWLYVVFVLAEILLVVPMIIIGNLLKERQTHITRLETTQRSAEKANKAKSEFLASMSHELRTPLNAVLGFAQLLQLDTKATLTKTQLDYIESIRTGGNHLLDLINDVLDLAKIEADQLEIDLKTVSACDISEECIAMTMHLGDANNIKIIDNINRDVAMEVRADPLRLKQVLLNLLSNAIKFNRINGTVCLDAHTTKDGFLNISITDTGIGIAPKDYERVFQKFQRVGADPMIAREGTGIGLTVTKLLIKSMSGRIGFNSKVDVGSTFWIEVPLAKT